MKKSWRWAFCRSGRVLDAIFFMILRKMTARHLHHREYSRWWRWRVWRLRAYLFSCSFSFATHNIVPPKHHDGISFDSEPSRFLRSLRSFVGTSGVSWLCRYFQAPHLISIPTLVESWSCQFLILRLASSWLYLTHVFFYLNHKGRQWMPKFLKTTVFISTGVITVSCKKRWRLLDTVLGAVLIVITNLAKHSIFSKILYEALRTIHTYVRNKVFKMELTRSGRRCTAVVPPL